MSTLTVNPAPRARSLIDHFEEGLDAPICLTWELTYACNLACVHCLSSSGRRDPRELSTEEARAIIDELERMQVFYVNIGGGEPTVRKDFWDLLDYATAHHVGVKFSTNGSRITPEIATRLAANSYVDVQISLDGATAEINDRVRGTRLLRHRHHRMENLQNAGMSNFKISVVMTRENVAQLDDFKAIADRYGAQLRITRLRPSGRGADVWDDLHPTQDQQRELYHWLMSHGENVLTGDSFFHLSAFGEALPGLNLCGAGRVVCLIDPIGDVYACPFAIHDAFLAGERARRGRGSPACGVSPSSSRTCASPRARGCVAAAPSMTAVAADAWPPSSSPGCPSMALTPSARSVTARSCWPPVSPRPRSPRPARTTPS